MAPPAGRPPDRAARSLFADRSFRVYWWGGLASNIGTWLQNVTAAVVILELTHSPFMVGVLSTATFLPVLLLSMLGGSLSDKYDKRMVVVVTQALSLLVAAAITVLSALGHLDAVLLIGLSGMLGVSYAVAKPALTALLPALVDRQDVARATAVNTLQFNVGQVAGSALSALVLTVSGATPAFALNTLSFAAPIVSMYLLRTVPLHDVRPKGSLLGSTRDGLRYVLASQTLLALLTGVALSNGAVEALRTLAPTLSSRALGVESSSAGILVTAFSIGATGGLLCFSWISRRMRPDRVLQMSFLLQALGLFVLAAAPNLVVAAMGAVPIGVGFALNIPVLSGSMQLLSPDEMRGRVMSMFSTIHLGLRPLFALLAGGLASLLPVRASTAMIAVFPLLGFLLAARTGRAVVDAADEPLETQRTPDRS
jgi:MFS family permease